MQQKAGTAYIGVMTLALLFGCADQPSAQLADEMARYNARDFAGAQTAADAIVAKNPGGHESAQAMYLKGHAIEQIASDSPAEARERLQQARTAYIAALTADGEHGPLEGLIRASLSNVSYWQEDYATAAQQGLAAAPLLNDPVASAWTYYRAGLSQQRLGQFSSADALFVRAIARSPGSDPAMRAEAHKGVRAFNIRILFDRPAAAAIAAAALGKRGMPVVRHDNTAGAAAELMVGSFNTYAAATAARAQMLADYPNAVVVP